MQPDSVDIDVKRAIRWLIASAVVVFVCGVLAIVLPVTFPVGIALILLGNPLLGIVLLSLVVGVVLVAEGIIEIVFFFVTPPAATRSLDID